MRKFVYGDILEIKMSNGDYCYAHYLRSPIIAFYDLKVERHACIDNVVACSIAFTVAVHDRVMKSEKWNIVGNIMPNDCLGQGVVFFRQDVISGKIFKHYEDGREELSSKKECENLERAAVWDPEHIEDRLEDYFKGVENKWVKSLKMK